jgi:uncharacterized protein
MRHLAVRCIHLYQRWLSPHKGFQCAYRVATGRDSCSAFAVRSISRVGIFIGLRLIRGRFRKCAAAYRIHVQHGGKAHQAFFDHSGHQSGHCDLPIGDFIDACDWGTPTGDCLCSACEWDFWNWRRFKRDKETKV